MVLIIILLAFNVALSICKDGTVITRIEEAAQNINDIVSLKSFFRTGNSRKLIISNKLFVDINYSLISKDCSKEFTVRVVRGNKYYCVYVYVTKSKT